MTDDTPAKRGDAAYRQHRDEVAQRNIEAHRRGRAERDTRDGMNAARDRINAAREAEQLQRLNDQLAQRPRGGA